MTRLSVAIWMVCAVLWCAGSTGYAQRLDFNAQPLTQTPFRATPTAEPNVGQPNAMPPNRRAPGRSAADQTAPTKPAFSASPWMQPGYDGRRIPRGPDYRNYSINKPRAESYFDVNPEWADFVRRSQIEFTMRPPVNYNALRRTQRYRRWMRVR